MIIFARSVSNSKQENSMNKILTLTLAVTALALAGCSTLDTPTNSQKTAIESVYAQRATLEKEQVSFSSNTRVAGLMAIDVRGCPPDFRSAWFDYLVAVQTLHARVERVAGVAAATGKPVSDLPSLIKFTVTSPELGQYLLAELDKVDEAWAKVERAGMNSGVMPKVGAGGARRPASYAG